jgi:hypothetical protein
VLYRILSSDFQSLCNDQQHPCRDETVHVRKSFSRRRVVRSNTVDIQVNIKVSSSPTGTDASTAADSSASEASVDADSILITDKDTAANNDIGGPTPSSSPNERKKQGTTTNIGAVTTSGALHLQLRRLPRRVNSESKIHSGASSNNRRKKPH